MNWRTIRTIFRKELLDTLRDKRTLIMMIGVPVVLYPAMIIVGIQGTMLQMAKLDEKISRVALQTEEPEVVQAWLEDTEKIEIVDAETPDQELDAGNVDAVVHIDGPVASRLADGQSIEVEIRYDSTEFPSMEASYRLQDALKIDAGLVLETRLTDRGLNQDYIEPIRIEREDMAPPAKTTGNMLGTVLPLLMVFMVALGAFYPAIDVTAGEKERGTFETLLSTPATKLEVVTGKFGTVFLLAMTTGLLNLGSMVATFLLIAKQLGPAADGVLQFDLQFPPQAVLVTFAVMVPLAFFISASSMAVAVFARSFKEAQNYLTPFILLLSGPAFLAVVPGVKLNATTQFVPIANVILLFRDLMTGKAEWDAIFYVFLSTVGLAAISLLFATWLFQREEVILSEEKGFPLTWRRSEFRTRTAITPFMAMGLYFVLLIVMFYLGGLLQTWKPLPGLLLTQWLLLLAPVVVLLWYVKVDIREALSLKPLSLANTAAALLLGVSSTFLIIQFGMLLDRVFPTPDALKEAMAGILLGGGVAEVIFVLLVAAVTPAICEEVLFRGAILSGLRPRLGTWPSIVAVGLLFGIFHVYVYRIPATALFGMVLTYLAIRTGSIFAPMLVHLINNAFAVLVLNEVLPEGAVRLLRLEQLESQGLPAYVLITAALGFATGVLLLEINARHTPRMSNIE